MARQTVCILLPEGDHRRSFASVQARPACSDVLVSDRQPRVLVVPDEVGCSRPAVWRWHKRYPEEVVDWLLRVKTWKRGTHLLYRPRSSQK